MHINALTLLERYRTLFAKACNAANGGDIREPSSQAMKHGLEGGDKNGNGRGQDWWTEIVIFPQQSTWVLSPYSTPQDGKGEKG